MSSLEFHFKFYKKTSQIARSDLEQIFCYVLECSKTILYTNKEVNISDDNLQVIKSLISRREQGEPLAYLLEKKGFWNIELHVNKDVLVPRPETETLIEEVLNNFGEEQLYILDAGTGSGAIILALANERKNWKFFALDKSKEALNVAIKNMKSLDLKINFVRANWMAALKANIFDVIVSNPPYISKHDLCLKEDGVKKEPLSSLVSESNGMSDLIKVIDSSSFCLRPGGILFIEHAPEQSSKVREHLKSSKFINLNVFKDLNGDKRISSGEKISL